MFTVLFTKSVSARDYSQTICVAEHDGRIYSIEKRELHDNGTYEYHFPCGTVATSESDIDIVKVLKSYLLVEDD